MKMSKLLATTALALSLTSGVATASPIVGSASISVLTWAGILGANNILGATGVTYQNPTGGDFTGAAGTSIDPFSLTLTIGSAFNFTSSLGDFSGTVVSIGGTLPSFANVVTQGTFDPADPLLDNNAMQVNFSLTEVGQGVGGGGAINSTFQPIGIPEPMTLALFGLGLAGLGVAARRKA